VGPLGIEIVKNKKQQFLIYLFVSAMAVFLFVFLSSSMKEFFPFSIQTCLTSPKFEDYSVEDGDWFLDNPSPVNFSGSKLDKSDQTAVRRSVARGVNFAGKYVINEKGCGVSCQSYTVVNVETGKIIISGLESSYGSEFRKNSTLLIINPRTDNWDGLKKNDLMKTFYYSMTDDKLELVCD